MKQTTHRAAMALSAFVMLAGCGDVPSRTGSAPPYEVVEEDRGNQTSITAEVDSTDDLEAVFEAVRSQKSDEGGYLVFINCSTGGTSGAEPRLANGRFAIGPLGAATTGQQDGGSEFEVVADASCPQDEGSPDDIATAQSIVDAFAAAGLPVTNPRDNTAGCTDLDCTGLITTDDISVYVFADEAAATRYQDAFGDGAYTQGQVTLSYAGARTPEEAQQRYEEVFAELVPAE